MQSLNSLTEFYASRYLAKWARGLGVGQTETLKKEAEAKKRIQEGVVILKGLRLIRVKDVAHIHESGNSAILKKDRLGLLEVVQETRSGLEELGRFRLSLDLLVKMASMVREFNKIHGFLTTPAISSHFEYVFEGISGSR